MVWRSLRTRLPWTSAITCVTCKHRSRSFISSNSCNWNYKRQGRKEREKQYLIPSSKTWFPDIFSGRESRTMSASASYATTPRSRGSNPLRMQTDSLPAPCLRKRNDMLQRTWYKCNERTLTFYEWRASIGKIWIQSMILKPYFNRQERYCVWLPLWRWTTQVERRNSSSVPVWSMQMLKVPKILLFKMNWIFLTRMCFNKCMWMQSKPTKISIVKWTRRSKILTRKRPATVLRIPKEILGEIVAEVVASGDADRASVAEATEAAKEGGGQKRQRDSDPAKNGD